MAEEIKRNVAEPTDGTGDRGGQDAVILRMDEAMARLSLSRSQVYRLVKDGILKARKDDASLEFHESDVAAAAAELARRRETIERWLQLFTERLAEQEIVDLPEICVKDEDSGVEELVSRLLLDCLAARASDFYVTPAESGDRLLVRNQGRLHEVCRMESEISTVLRAKLKALAPLPEEAAGRHSEAIFCHTNAQHAAQVRVSVVSTPAGEHIHLQFFYSGGEQTLAGIGYSSRQCEALHRLLAERHGLVVLAGSHDRIMQEQRVALANHMNSLGKLTVAIDCRLNYQSGNTIHIEDRGAAGSDDSDPWVTAMRLCPDVIMLDRLQDGADGEALVAALAAGITVVVEVPGASGVAAVAHFAEFGMSQREMLRHFLVASEFCSLSRLCPDCRKPRSVSAEEAEFLSVPAATQLCEPVGCDHCEGGFRGNCVLWGLLLRDDVDLTDSCGDSVLQSPSGGALLLSDVSLPGALRRAALAGDVTPGHIMPFLR